MKVKSLNMEKRKCRNESLLPYRKEKNRGHETIWVIIHIYMEISQ
jgi:hypothetical protein